MPRLVRVAPRGGRDPRARPGRVRRAPKAPAATSRAARRAAPRDRAEGSRGRVRSRSRVYARARDRRAPSAPPGSAGAARSRWRARRRAGPPFRDVDALLESRGTRSGPRRESPGVSPRRTPGASRFSTPRSAAPSRPRFRSALWPSPASRRSCRGRRGAARRVRRPAVPAALLRAEARLLASQALLNIGRLAEAREAADAARRRVRDARRRSVQRRPLRLLRGERPLLPGRRSGAPNACLKAAAGVFADFAQDHWVGRAEGMLAQIARPSAATARARSRASTPRSSASTPSSTQTRYAAPSLNRARCLALLGRLRGGEAGLAQALQVARRRRLDMLVFAVRQNLAELELLRGDFEKALASYIGLAAEADGSASKRIASSRALPPPSASGASGVRDEMMARAARGRAARRRDRSRGKSRVVRDRRAPRPGRRRRRSRLGVREHLEAARDGFVLPFRAARRA